jgi:very-short-patch-repair endonuclease
MNAVEIEEAVSQLAEAPFDPEEFPFAFLEAFGNKKTTIKRLKSQRNSTNKSDLDGVLQRNNIHIKVCLEGEVTDTLTALRESPATAKQKAKFILATDGKSLEAENLADGETIVCDYPEFHNHFGFFLPLAGITTVKQIRENAFDIKATGRLNKLYVELLNENPDWDSAERREELNHLMARLIFCFFAEDTNIFYSNNLFTDTIAQMSAGDSSNTHEVLEELFRAMATPLKQREKAGIRNWANGFPYVNGGLFSPHPLTPSPLSPSGRGAGGEGNSLGKYPHPLAPSPKQREGGQETMSEGKYWEIPPALKKKMTEVARQFRKEPTPSEKILWQALRGRKLEGRKFRRQQPIGAFIVDFFCGAERLIVEVDGGIHQSQQEADQQRQELLESLGLKVVRVSSELVETNLAEALAVVRQGFSPHPLTPSPKQGEGGQETPTPLSPSGRGAGGEGLIVPRFSRIARSYLLHVGNLDWTKINPDIFGSMIQAVADEDERGALGMHYTSVPNILKVLNPLFLDDLREQLAAAGDNGRKLLNLRKRLARIRVFDPACGSGNFLVIAYKEMRAIEAEINQRRGEADRASEIPLTNFRGIEIRHFSCEIARLALIIAEYQCDVLYRGQRLALAEFLPLKAENWITCGNALRLDWLSLCPPTDKGVRVQREDLDLWQETRDEAEIEFENEGGETYICGNPPYKGTREQTTEQKDDLKKLFEGRGKGWKSLDYVAGWFLKAVDHGAYTNSVAAFVSTNSVCQGQHVPILWSILLSTGHIISFAHTSFKWANLASHNAGVTVVVIGLTRNPHKERSLYSINEVGEVEVKKVSNISPYLVEGQNLIISKLSQTLSKLPEMRYGNYPGDGNHLTLSPLERNELVWRRPELNNLVRPLYGAQEFIKGLSRYCLWIDDENLELAKTDAMIANRIKSVRNIRLKSRDKSLNKLATRSHQYRDRNVAQTHLILIPTVSSEQRDYIPTDLKRAEALTTNQAFALYDAPLWNMAIIASRLHLVWIATVCGKLKTDYRYSNTLGWNTFPVPTLTEQNKTDLTRCAEDILLAREQYFPATIADMYDPERMDKEFPLVREAHERNDEVLERIYIGRRFKNDTERLEKLFELYTKMTAPKSS